MKKFTIRLLSFILLLGVCDAALGYIFRLYDHTHSGSIHKVHDMMTKEKPDLLVLGSSRACHHYDTQMISDSLKLNAFNGGFVATGLSVGYGFLTGIAQRHFPRYIICELTPHFDLYEENGTPFELDRLYPYINIPEIAQLIAGFDPADRWKTASNAYRLNSQLPRILSSVMNKNNEYISGYLPLDGSLDPAKTKGKLPVPATGIDSVKEKYLRKLIQTAKSNGSEIIFAVSPVYGGQDVMIFKDELDILNDYDVRVLNHLNEPTIIHDSNLFQDETHLNGSGARLYTGLIISELADIVSTN